MILAYRKIFKQAYEITRDNKFLWIFGLFLSVGSVLNFNLYMPSGQNSIEVSDSAALMFVLIALFVIVLYFRAKAGLIVAVKATLDKQETNFWRAFRLGGIFFNRILIISILIELGLILLGLVLSGPIVYMFNQHFTSRAIVLLILALLIFIPVAVLAILVNVLAPMFAVIFDLKIRQATASAFELVLKNKTQLSILGLLLLLAEFLPLFLASIVLGLQHGLSMGLLSSGVFLVVASAITVFAQTAWVLAFLELIKPQKLEEEDTLPVPETT